MDALRGIALLWRTPRLWGLALGPLAAVACAYIALGVAGAVFLFPHITEWLRGVPGGEWLGRLGELAAVVLYLFAFPLFFTLLGGIFFGVVFERLSIAVEQTVTGTAPTPVPLRASATIGDSLARLLVNGALGLGAFLLGFALGPIPGIVAAALVGLLDYTSPAFLRRGVTLGPQTRALFSRLDAPTLSFALVAGLLSLVPFLGVLLMPGLIAGGTLLVCRRAQDKADAGAN